ncbi:MAG: Ig-like domain-containing protein, partial [Verrucomicrobiota bacterium]
MSIVEGLSTRILFIAAFLFAAQGESFSANVPYFTDFESGIGTEWSSTNRSTTYPQYFTTFSGRFGNESQSLTIGGLTVGQYYTVGCDLYVIDSWDGSSGPDTFAIEVDGNQSFRETFSNYNGNPPSNPQSFPYSPDLGRFDMGFSSSFVDAIYRNIEVTFTASNATSVITFRGISLQDISDESWGIDNVYVKTAAEAAQSQINVTSLPDNNSTVSRIIESFSVTANHPLDPTSASTASNYNLVEAGANGTFGNSDDVIISLTPQFTSGKSVGLTIATAQAPLQPGKYRFVISTLKDTNNAALLGYTNTFTIANPVLGQIESLSNDTIPTAVSLSLTESPVGSRLFTAFALGRFTTTSDVDYWRFNAEAGDLVTIRLEADDLGVYPRAFLQDSSGTGLNNSYGNYEGIVGFQNYRISTPGTYYVRTYTDNKASGYRMRVDVARGLQYESEDNDSLNQANALNLTIISGAYSATVAGALEAYDGAGDYFRLGILNPGNAVALNLTYPQGGTLSASNSTIEIYKEGSSAAVATNNGTSLNFTILEDGNYFARLVNNAPDIRAQYLLNLNIVDGVAPVVTSTTLPTEGSNLNTIVDRFTVSFSEELQAASAMLASNYELRSAGADNTFGNGDDVLYTLAPQSYTSGLTVSFLISDGPLQSGKYRFTAKTTLKDRADNALGAAYTRSFTVDSLPGYARESRDNDTGATATDLVLSGNSGENFKVASGHGNLSSSSDKDYWSFQASQGDLVIITTESTSHASGTGLLWYILKEDGNQLTYFYSDSNGTGQSPPITIPADGKYLLLPQRWYDYFDEYRFRVSISHPQTPGALVGETEGNNNVNQANVPALQLNAGVQSVQIIGVGTYGDPGDVFRLGNLAFGAEIQANIYTPSNSAFQGKLDILRQDGTSVASSAEGATNVSFTIPADGANIYYLKVTDTTAGGLDHHYFATLKVNDSTAPIITSISLPDEGSTNTYVGADFSIGFSEDMLASTVNTNVNYELKNTTTGDLYTISNGNYSSGLSVGLSIIDGPLQPGNYQFT